MRFGRDRTASVNAIIIESAFHTKSETNMSHFTTIKVQIKNGELLHQVFEELGYQVECNVQVRGYRGDKTNAEYVIRQANGYDLGFRRSNERSLNFCAIGAGLSWLKRLRNAVL